MGKKNGDAESALAELDAELVRIRERISELEKERDSCAVGRFMAIAAELASLRASVPMIEERIVEARAQVDAEHETARIAALKVAYLKEEELWRALQPAYRELEQRLGALRDVQFETIRLGGNPRALSGVLHLMVKQQAAALESATRRGWADGLNASIEPRAM